MSDDLPSATGQELDIRDERTQPYCGEKFLGEGDRISRHDRSSDLQARWTACMDSKYIDIENTSFVAYM
jgi:hypothetical protein